MILESPGSCTPPGRTSTASACASPSRSPSTRILSHVGLDHDPPPIAPARDPPQGQLDFEQQAPEDYDQSKDAPDDLS